MLAVLRNLEMILFTFLTFLILAVGSLADPAEADISNLLITSNKDASNSLQLLSFDLQMRKMDRSFSCQVSLATTDGAMPQGTCRRQGSREQITVIMTVGQPLPTVRKARIGGTYSISGTLRISFAFVIADGPPTFIQAIIPAKYIKDVSEDFDVCYFSTEKTLIFGDSPMVFVEDEDSD